MEMMAAVRNRDQGSWRAESLKSARERMDIVNAYAELGSYRAAAAECGTTHRTVKKVIERLHAGGVASRHPRPRNTDGVADLIAEKVRVTEGRICAKRILPMARATGFEGSARNFRRAVAAAKGEWRRQRRVYRPWIPSPGEHLVIDWGQEAGMQLFCAVLPWSRDRFVRFGPNQRRETTLALLAECFEEVGGVPSVVLSDRMACLKASTVAGLVVPHPDYVRFATHFGFRPDFCEVADPESKGVVEALVGYAKADVLILDDWGLARLSAEERQDLLEIVEDRYQLRSTIVASQLPVDTWHNVIGDPTLGDAVLDRLVHSAYRISLSGASMSRKLASLTQ